MVSAGLQAPWSYSMSRQMWPASRRSDTTLQEAHSHTRTVAVDVWVLWCWSQEHKLWGLHRELRRERHLRCATGEGTQGRQRCLPACVPPGAERQGHFACRALAFKKNVSPLYNSVPVRDGGGRQNGVSVSDCAPPLTSTHRPAAVPTPSAARHIAPATTARGAPSATLRGESGGQGGCQCLHAAGLRRPLLTARQAHLQTRS